MRLTLPTDATDFDSATCADALDEINRLLQGGPGGEPIDLLTLVNARDAVQDLLFRARDWLGLRTCGEQGVTRLMLEVQFSRINEVIRTTLDVDLTVEILTEQIRVASSALRTLSRERTSSP
jgi:hypothetical protein